MDDDLFLRHQVGNVPLNGDEDAETEDELDSWRLSSHGLAL